MKHCLFQTSVNSLVQPVTLLTATLLSALLPAEDRVTYRLGGGQSRPITVVGEIRDYDGEQLLMMTISGAPQVVPAEDIVSVQTHYDTAHRQALAAYQQGRIDEAASKFITAFDREPRDWVDREIAAWIVRCRLLLDDRAGAIQFFREVIRNDPVSRHWGIAPLVWSPAPLDDDTTRLARSLLVSSRRGEQLMGASILLFDPISGTIAERTLSDLAGSTNPRISRLARAQLWRLSIVRQEVTHNIVSDWLDQVQSLPASLRPGPQYLIGRAQLALGEPRLAAAEFLKLTILYPQHDALTARATFEAAEAIERTGLTQEADLLYREILVRFPVSHASNLARQRLAERKPPT